MIDVSIIIPCFNSQNLIESRVEEVEAVMSCTKWTWEILLCDDGSLDQTAAVCQRLAERSEKIRFFPNPVNRGRGKNVSDGILASQSQIVGFIDADSSTAAAYLVPVIQVIESGCDLAEAQRNYKIWIRHLPYIFDRLSAHIVYAWLVRLLLGMGRHDTESGFKFFKRDVAMKLMPLTHATGWFWDTEVIANAHASGYCVAEVPSLFVRPKGMSSTVRLAHDSWVQFFSLIRYARTRKNCSLQGRCCREN